MNETTNPDLSTPPLGAAWRPLPLALLHVAAILLFASWWVEGSRALLWQPLDETLFEFLNGTLGCLPDWWGRFWAFANTRAFDALSAGLMLGLYAIHILGNRRAEMAKRMAELLFMLLAITAALAVAEETLMGIQRPSPSLELGTDYRLSQMYPEIRAKDQSPSSFPSDHGMVLLAWTGYLWLTAGRRLGLAAAGLSIFFLLPRMVGGGHWLTDTAVGGAVVALITLAWLFCTPIQSWGVRILTPVMRPIAFVADRVLGLVWKVDR